MSCQMPFIITMFSMPSRRGAQPFQSVFTNTTHMHERTPLKTELLLSKDLPSYTAAWIMLYLLQVFAKCKLKVKVLLRCRDILAMVSNMCFHN